MSIHLPESSHDFSSPAYWRRFFAAQRQDAAFEWYGDYSQLSATLERYLKPSNSVLQIGCGNSQLAEQLWDNGIRRVHSIDTDERVIERMREKHRVKRPELTFEVKSAEEVGCGDGAYSVVLDKGTVDALLPPDYEPAQGELVDRILDEVNRVLSPAAGRFITITLAQRHIVDKVVGYFWQRRRDYLLRVHQCDSSSTKDNDGGRAGSKMPVFAIVATKLKIALPKQSPIEFFVSSSISSPSSAKVSNTADLLRLIEAEQELNWFKHHVAANRVGDARMTLCGVDGQPRFELNVVDEDDGKRKLLSYAVFIVPLGRDTDWLFSTPRGRQSLRRDCAKDRLLVVRLYRQQSYASMEAIQSELGQIAVALKPHSCVNQAKIPFLSLGSVDTRECIAEGESPITGKWVVEHVQRGEKTFRQLVFLENPFMVQSEVEMVPARKGRGKPLRPATNSLSFACHRAMVAALDTHARDPSKPLKMAVLGLGGGLLARYLHDHYPHSTIECVELDGAVVELARQHFGFPAEGESRMGVSVEDAMDYLRRGHQSARLDVLFLDLSTTNTEGITCPPPAFTSHEAFELMRGCLNPAANGVLLFNLVSRDEEVVRRVKETAKEVFDRVESIKPEDVEEEELNEVVICMTGY